MSILLGACSVDVGKLRAPNSRVPDGAADLHTVSDAAGARGDADGPGGTIATDSLVSPDLPESDDVAALDDVTALPDPDATAPGDTTDYLDRPMSDENAGEALSDDAGSAGNDDGSGGTGGVDANDGGHISNSAVGIPSHEAPHFRRAATI